MTVHPDDKVTRAAAGDWRSILREARRSVGVSQQELAARVGLSRETVRAYEGGRRRPTREHLELLIGALKVPNADANRIREEAGFAPLRSVFINERDRHYYYAPGEYGAVVEEQPWPEFAVNDAMEVLAANHAARAVWGIDFEERRRGGKRARMNLLSVAADYHFTERVTNWDECVAVLASIYKANEPQRYSLEGDPPYFAEVVVELLRGAPEFIARLMDVWNGTEARDSKVRWGYPVTWADPEFGVMRFKAIVSLASEPDATFFNDWIPVDAESWQVLERVKGRTDR